MTSRKPHPTSATPPSPPAAPGPEARRPAHPAGHDVPVPAAPDHPGPDTAGSDLAGPAVRPAAAAPATEARATRQRLVPSAETAHLPPPGSPRELLDALPELSLRIELINGRMIVSPMGTPEHADAAMALYDALAPVAKLHGWRAYTGNVDVCIDGPRDAATPDFVIAPVDCPRWGTRELLSTGLLLVAEVVSPGSVREDREDKPDLYARGGVPVLLVIDPLDSPPSVTVLSSPKDGRYQTATCVVMGKPLRIPGPINFDLDTAIFLVEPPAARAAVRGR
ncbi:Uma2 family endonuclease [Sphaerisporangium rufum]|nr:Uma2 family endonuclease [Sphaerisporangium rufum]